MSDTVLVTGATGFVGANLVRRLLSEGYDVHLLVRDGYQPWRIAAIQQSLSFHHCDLTNLAHLQTVLSSIRPHAVLHTAVYGAYQSQADHTTMIETNILGTWNLFLAATQVGCQAIISTGSSSEYGYIDHAPDEQEHIDPNSPYAITKATATHLARYFSLTTKIPITTLRLYSVYGPWEEPGRLIPTLLLHALDGTLPPLVDPHIARDFVYVDDVVDAYLQVLRTPKPKLGAIYNIASEHQTTLAALVKRTRALFSIKQEPVWGSFPARVWDTSVWVGKTDTIQQEIGWKAATTLDSGLTTTAAWLETMRPHYRKTV